MKGKQRREYTKVKSEMKIIVYVSVVGGTEKVVRRDVGR